MRALPLDNRRDYHRISSTGCLWTATLADNNADFEKLVAPAFQWASETPTRVPLTDWYDTVTMGKQQGFQGANMVGGLFIKMLSDPEIWKKYSSRGLTASAHYGLATEVAGPADCGLSWWGLSRCGR